MKHKLRFTQLVIAVAACLFTIAQRSESGASWTGSPSQAEATAGDELGMARELGPATWARCAVFLSNPDAKIYELSHVRSSTMPLSPFAGPFEKIPTPTRSITPWRPVSHMRQRNTSVSAASSLSGSTHLSSIPLMKDSLREPPGRHLERPPG